MTPERARRVAPLLEELARTFDQRRRRAVDPVELPHRYRRREDIEVAALLAASLAYGRVDLFRPKLEVLLEGMGQSPADFAAHFDPHRNRRVFADFQYRFNVPADLAVLTAAAGARLRERGTLEPEFAPDETLQQAVSRFTADLRSHPRRAIEAELGPVRGLAHLLPDPLKGGTSKRLMMFLRWMVRGPDAVDFGLWRNLPPARLVIPLDTHIARMSQHLGLTDRRDLSWWTSLEITDSLRQVDAQDPVRFDFVLCHFGMSGACPLHIDRATCRACPLLAGCRTGRRKLGKTAPAG